LLIAAAHADFPDSEIRIDTLAFHRVKKLATTVRLAQWLRANIATKSSQLHNLPNETSRVTVSRTD